MAENLNIDTTDLERVERPPAPRVLPPIEQPVKSPFYRGQMPSTAVVNPDAVNNFRSPGIPSYRIVPPQPLALAGSGFNAAPATTTVPALLQPTPAPTISQSLVSVPTGYTFSFLQVRLPLGSTNPIVTYKIYRNTASVSASATVIRTIPHNPANTGVPITVQDSQPNGVTMFYWVSAVSSSGLESSLTPAQSKAVPSNAGLNSNSQLATTFHGLPVNSSFAPIDSTVLSNNGVSTLITVSSNTLQFAPGQLSNNSGTLAPGVFGTSFVFADDPQFQGGAVIYGASTSPVAQVLAEGRLSIGKIKTANASSSSGGGFSGGTTSGSITTGAGGRGLVQF